MGTRQVRTGVSEVEFNDRVVDVLRHQLSDGTVYEQAMGGGISCVWVESKPYGLCFGTANEPWGADVYQDDEFVDRISVETDCLTTEPNPHTVATAIAQAAVKFFSEHAEGQ